MSNFVDDLVAFLLSEDYIIPEVVENITEDIENYMISRGYLPTTQSGLLIDLENYLISNNFASVDGVDIFRDYTPSDPSNIIVLSEYAGQPGLEGVDTQVRSVQVLVRNTSYQEARTKIHAIYNKLHQAENPIINLTATRWVISQPRQVPFQLNRDEQQRITFIFNVALTTQKD